MSDEFSPEEKLQIQKELYKKLLLDPIKEEAKHATKPNAGKRLRCRQCGDIIQSAFRWDMKWCKGHHIFIDGGGDYCRMGGNPEDFEWLDGEKKDA